MFRTPIQRALRSASTLGSFVPRATSSNVVTPTVCGVAPHTARTFFTNPTQETGTFAHPLNVTATAASVQPSYSPAGTIEQISMYSVVPLADVDNVQGILADTGSEDMECVEGESVDQWEMSSVLKKRRLKMNKHKYKKRRKRDRAQRNR
eukprot:GFYU01014436.1.p1 GENE.GFYU01014436.1~~GFYU01014436.1.p1  ORF type:complete len:150 (-),score=10.61 GFYU01014436.1:77-526(-)